MKATKKYMLKYSLNKRYKTLAFAFGKNNAFTFALLVLVVFLFFTLAICSFLAGFFRPANAVFWTGVFFAGIFLIAVFAIFQFIVTSR